MLEKIIPQLAELEKSFLDTPDVTQYIAEVGKYLRENDVIEKFKNLSYEDKKKALSEFDRHLASILPNPNDFEQLVIRAFLLGTLIQQTEKVSGKSNISLATLPKKIQEAAKEFKLSETEIRALEYSMGHTGNFISAISDMERNKTKEIVFDYISKVKHGSYKDIRIALERAIGTNNDIDWQKVAVYEMNGAYNNGYLAKTGVGRYVIGHSQPDCCEYCRTMIKGKVFKVIDAPAGDYNIDPTSKEYQQMSEIYDKCVWIGKNNIGRYRSGKVRKDGETFDRDHHEKYTPCIPLHNLCRCRFIEIIIAEQYVDKQGLLQFRVDNLDAHAKWLKAVKEYFKNV